MSADRPTGGDSYPDRFSGGEDRPFPGAPEDREPAPELPKNTLSMEELRAVYQRSDSLAELQAAAKAHEEAQTRAAGPSDSPGSESPDSAPAGEGPTAVPQDGTDALGEQQAEDLPRAEGPTRPGSDLMPFPGAPGDRKPPAELPKNTLSMEELRAIHQKSSSSAELEAMAAEYAEAGNGGDAGPARGRSRVMPDDVPESTEDSGRAERGSEDSGGQSRPAAAEESRRVEVAAGPVNPNGHNDAQEQSAENQPGGRDQVAEPVRERPRAPEHEPETRPGTGVEQADEQRWAAMEQRMQSAMEQKLEAALDGIKADYESKLQEQKAEHKAETDSIKAEYESKETRSEARISELESDLEETKRLLQSLLDRDRDTGDQSGLSGPPDAARHSERQDERDGATPDVADLNTERNDIISRIDETTRPELDVADRTESDLAKAGKKGLDVAGSLALVNPVLQVAVTADTARRTYNDLSPEDKYKVNEMMGTFVTASGSMSPGSAVAAVTLAAVIPTLRDKLHDAVGKIRRKD